MKTVGLQVQFVQRPAYRDILGMLLSQELDAAWICGWPWVVNQSHLRGLSTPYPERHFSRFGPFQPRAYDGIAQLAALHQGRSR